MVSNIGMSIDCPSPVRSRCSSAARIACVALSPTNAIGDRCRGVARFAGDPSGQRRQRRQPLDQIVIGRPPGIRAFFTKAVQAGIDKPWVDSEQIVCAKLGRCIAAGRTL